MTDVSGVTAPPPRPLGDTIHQLSAIPPLPQLSEVVGSGAETLILDVVVVAVAGELLGGGAPGAAGVGGVGDGAEEGGEPFGGGEVWAAAARARERQASSVRMVWSRSRSASWVSTQAARCRS